MSSEPKKFVIDTNVLVSAALFPQSLAAQALSAAFALGTVYRSRETLDELRTVLGRPKFDRYFVDSTFTRAAFLALYEQHAVEAPITQVSTDCVDPGDNMFLALSVEADVLISGDKAHVLPMHPYRGIAILSLGEFRDWVLQGWGAT